MTINAGTTQIKAAYWELAKKFHPDKNPGDPLIEEKFKEITEAYNVLSDPEKRRKYDLKFIYKSNAATGSSRAKKNRSRERYAESFAKKKKDAPLSKKEKRELYILFGSVISIVLLIVVMLIFSPEDDETKRKKELLGRIDSIQQILFPATDSATSAIPFGIKTADSPFDSIFQNTQYDDDSRNSIILKNSLNEDAVVLLINQKQNIVIRNEFIAAHEIYRFTAIPDGYYYIMAYTGNDWNAEKTNPAFKKGAFNTVKGYYIACMDNESIEMRQFHKGKTMYFTSAEIDLFNIISQESNRTDSLNFFNSKR